MTQLKTNLTQDQLDQIVYREDRYSDCIKFHWVHGVMATAGTLWVASIIEDGIKQEGYRVEDMKDIKELTK